MAKQLNRRRFLGYLVAAPTLTVAVKWSADVTRLTIKDGVVTGPDGQTASYGELAAAAAAGTTVSVTAQGTAVHSEYQRVTKALVVVDAGFAVNPRGLEAQMIGGVHDGIALALTSSLHIAGGLPLEGSWDNYFYTRQWNTPPDVEVIVMPATSNLAETLGDARLLVVGGAGSLLADGRRLVDDPGFPETYRAEALIVAEALEYLRGLPDGADQRTGTYKTGADSPVGESISAEDYAVALIDEISKPARRRRRFTVAS